VRVPLDDGHRRARARLRRDHGRPQPTPLRRGFRRPHLLPPARTVFLSQDWKFTAPVYIGDRITGSAEVLDVHETKPVCRLSVRVARDDGEGGEVEVLVGEAWCYRFFPE
jgi:hypothetical protein